MITTVQTAIRAIIVAAAPMMQPTMAVVVKRTSPSSVMKIEGCELWPEPPDDPAMKVNNLFLDKAIYYIIYVWFDDYIYTF